MFGSKETMDDFELVIKDVTYARQINARRRRLKRRDVERLMRLLGRLQTEVNDLLRNERDERVRSFLFQRFKQHRALRESCEWVLKKWNELKVVG